MVQGIELALSIFTLAFQWIFNNEYTALLVGLGLVMFVFALVFAKVRG